MRRIVFATLLLFLAFISCKKDDNTDHKENAFIVTYDGASFHCTGLKSMIEAKDIERLNLILGNESNTGNVIGLVDLKNTYQKNDKIKVFVTQYRRPEDQHCPAFISFPSVRVLKEELVK